MRQNIKWFISQASLTVKNAGVSALAERHNRAIRMQKQHCFIVAYSKNVI